MESNQLSIEKLKKLQFKVMVDVAASALVPLMRIGDKLNLFIKLDELGPVTTDELAVASEVDERYLREWLSAMAAAGFVMYIKEQRKFFLSPEQSAVFAREESGAMMMGAYDFLSGSYQMEDAVRHAFQTGEGIPYAKHCPACFRGTARFFRPAYQKNLIQNWLPKISNFENKMNDGGKFADVGCGYGMSTMMIANAFPDAKVFGFDIHQPSINEAKLLANEANLLNRIDYQAVDAKSYEGEYDFIAFFDCLHDMGDPLGALKHAFQHMKIGGSIILIEPCACDELHENFNTIGQMYYSFSTMACIPTSKSQEVGTALGAQAGPAKLIQILSDAGFKNGEVVKKNASNMVIEAKKT